MKLTKALIDEKSARDGDWITDIPQFEDVAIFTRSLDCPAANNYSFDMIRKTLGRKQSRKAGSTPLDVLNYANSKTLIEICVSDWKNVELPVDADGKITFDPNAVVEEREVPFSKEALETLLLEDAPKDGIRVEGAPGDPVAHYKTPDGKQARFAMREVFNAFSWAANQVSFPEGGDTTVKKPLRDGSSPTGKSPITTKSKTSKPA